MQDGKEEVKRKGNCFQTQPAPVLGRVVGADRGRDGRARVS